MPVTPCQLERERQADGWRDGEKMERSGKGGVSEGDEEEEGGTALSSVIRK